MKSQLIAIVAAVLVVVCGPSEADRALLKAAERGNIKAVKQQLAAGADVNAKYNGGWTALHGAAGVGGHKEIAELLIQNGADVNAKGDFGKTPLDYAKGYKETADLLRKHGAK